MKLRWGTAWLRSRKWLKAGWVFTAVLVAVYAGLIRPSQAFHGIASEKTTALAAIERNRHWLVPLPESVDNAGLAAGVIAGVPGAGVFHRARMTLTQPEDVPDRKLVRATSINLLVKSPSIRRDNPFTDGARRWLSGRMADKWGPRCDQCFGSGPGASTTI
jgi:hypothetical protein